MASITIRNLDNQVKTRLKMRAIENDRSMAEEVRVILRDAVAGEDPIHDNLLEFTRECFAEVGPFELELPPREPMRDPPDFS